MGELLAAVARHRNLLDAWQEVADTDDPSPAVHAFEKGVLDRLADLADQVRAGTWRPGPVHLVDIPKTSGGVRQLRIGTVADRIVERAVLNILDPVIDPLLQPCAHAYRRGLGARTAVDALTTARDAGQHWVARGDITDCFDTIPRWPLLQQLRRCVPDPELCEVTRLLICRPVAGQRGDPPGHGLHQGSALSPLLCNLYLDTFDRAMLIRGWTPVRYADDLAIPAATRLDAAAALEAAAGILTDLQLQLNPAKTSVASFDTGVAFVGHTVTAGTRTPTDRFEHPLEATVYVTTEDALIRRRGERLQVDKGGEKLLGVGLHRVRQIVCVGRVGMTSGMIEAASRRAIDVTWLHDDGAFCSRLHHTYDGDVTLRRAQYRHTAEPGATLRLARDIVTGKINNMQAHLRRAAARGRADLAGIADRLGEARTELPQMQTLDQLRGSEGRTTRDYFTGLAAILGDNWPFPARQRRPPPDPVNAMLSFGYTLLVNEAIAACELAGLDPYAGALHADRAGRPSLALDLMEECRPMIVDTMIVRLTATGQITPADFVTDETAGTCRLTYEGRRTFITGYERRMLTLFRHITAARTVSYRVGLHLQARTIAKVFLGTEDHYQPMTWR
ncbi:CRISPR-associated endonuclease Cas1 [Dactylosporangium sp. NPDC049525]|uniref:CRISPR-associated endonuclease Cas1 n=1 Tax=Dactylosporangium sp. NPDC049525 TaxID=3154730 RepID=UPI0034257595